MSDKIAIKVENLSKVYKLYSSPVDRLRESLHPLRRQYHHDFYALRNVSFEVKKGETLALIGRNGSGKSTLLKIITGVLTPSDGNVTVNGKIAALLELGAGFNPELSGIENVYFNGMLMGYKRNEMDGKLDEILSFADIGEFAQQPVKCYSSGMFVRLAFAIAINVSPDVLIVDEALSVGDVLFQAKCMDKIKTLMSSGVTTLFVTHDMNTVNTLCNTAIMLNEGNIFTKGSPQVVSLQYYQFIREQEHANQLRKSSGVNEAGVMNEQNITRIKDKKSHLEYSYGTGKAIITSYSVINSLDSETTAIQCGENFKVIIRVEFYDKIINPMIGYTISNVSGQNLMSIHMYHDGEIKIKPQNKGDVVEVELETTMMLNPGRYLLSLGVVDMITLSDFTNLDSKKNICTIEVYGKEIYHGLIHHKPIVRVINT